MFVAEWLWVRRIARKARGCQSLGTGLPGLFPYSIAPNSRSCPSANAEEDGYERLPGLRVAHRSHKLRIW